MRLEGKVALVVGAGQTPGATMGNGRATALLYAREGARVLLADRNLASAEETRSLITAEGGEALAVQSDATREEDCRGLAQRCMADFGRIDVLHNNVGIGDGDSSVIRLEEAAWDRIFSVNLKTVFLTCKHVLPLMRKEGRGSIINISSVAAVAAMPLAAYKTSKAAVNALTQQLAIANAQHGIRVNAIMPGLIETPMAIEGISRARGIDREELIAQRNARVPLGRRMGGAWDIAYASCFLASDEAAFITGAILPVDGGQSLQVG